MQRTFLSALVLAAVSAPLAAAVAFDHTVDNALDARVASHGPDDQIAKRFVLGVSGELKAAELVMTDTDAALYGKLRLYSDAHGAPGALIAQSDKGNAVLQGARFLFDGGFELVAGEEYWFVFAANADLPTAWRGDHNDTDMALLMQEGAWIAQPDIRLSLVVEIADVLPPQLIGQSEDITLIAGESAALLVQAGGSGPFQYQWYQGAAGEFDNPVPFATGPELIVGPAHSAQYWVSISNEAGMIESGTFSVEVLHLPEMLSQPQDQVIQLGQSAFLRVSVTGSAPFIFQWFMGDAGDTSNPVQGIDSSVTVAPKYTVSFWVLVSNAAGEVSSKAALITVIEQAPPAFEGGNGFSLAQTGKALNVGLGIVSDINQPAGNLVVELASGPQGLVIGDIVNAGGAVSADFAASAEIAPGEYELVFMVSDEVGNATYFTVMVTITANTAPVLGGIQDRQIARGMELAVELAAFDAEQPASELSFSFAVDNAALVDPNSGLSIASADSLSLVITPRTNHVGVVQITMTATDACGMSATVKFSVQVGDETADLWIAPIADVQMLMDGNLLSIAVDALNGTADMDYQPLAFAADHAVLPPEAMLVEGAYPHFTLTLMSLTGNTGETQITVTLTNGETTATRVFRVQMVNEMLLTSTAPAAAADSFDGNEGGACAAGAGGGVAMLGLAALPLFFRRRK